MTKDVTSISSEGPAADARKRQVDYYTQTASAYDTSHVGEADEHAMALGWLAALAEQRRFSSILDVGSGTGRVLRYLKRLSWLNVRGIEPVAALREQGYAAGLTRDELTEGDAMALKFADASIDVVCAFGVLHHIKDHRRAVSEMCRVARRGIFISDANNFGQGAPLSRVIKQSMRSLGLWSLYDRARMGNRGYHYSEGDGVYFSYSLFDDLTLIKHQFQETYFMSTRPSGPNLFRSAQTVALFATNDPIDGSCGRILTGLSGPEGAVS